MKKFMYLSRKCTHRNDGFITFWGHDSKGYRWFEDQIGEYAEACEVGGYKDDPVINVESSIVKGLFESCVYEGKIVRAVLNTPENRAALGIKKNDLQRYGRSCNLATSQNIGNLRLIPGAIIVRTSNGAMHQVEACEILA